MDAELAERLNGRTVVASISGGKDSGAMSLWLHEQGIEHRRVFMDTGWEHPTTYEYLRGELAQKIGPIVELKPKLQMVDLIYKKAMFPSRVRRFCTQELKVFPMRDYLGKMMDGGEEAINTVGIRAAESEARSKMPEWEFSDTFDCDVWRPLIRWSEQDVIDIHQRHGLRPNPLYLQGAARVGCWPCIFSRKSEIRYVAENDPTRIDMMRAMEAYVARAAAARYAAKGETFESLGYGAPSWFQSRFKSEGGKPWPIDRVVEWSKTSRGGKEFEPFIDPSMDGCMRWGLCEAADTKKGGGEE